jgi:hypothetical protein
VGVRGLAPLLVAMASLASGCAFDEGDGGDDLAIGSSQHASVVGDHVGSDCSTEVVLGLSRQISNEVQCLTPDSFTRFEEGNGIVFAGSAVLPYLTPPGKRDLEAAVAARGGQIQINSAFRTVAQQYLLVQWHDRGRCGITAAAPVGASNHETGRALDVGNYGDWVGALGNHGWAHDVPGDEVHFDHLSSPDLRGYDVLAFQRLWNRNHEDDQIDEDGLYGPMTEARLVKSPADGFPIGACGDKGPWDGELVAADLPDMVAPGGRAEVTIRIKNTGSETWRPGATFLGTSAPMDRDSALYDPDNWVAPNRVASVDGETKSGETGTFSFTILAPDQEQVLTETFKLVEDGVSWFGPPVELEVRVSNDASLSGACSAAGGSGATAAALLVLAVMASFPLRRRRATLPAP